MLTQTKKQTTSWRAQTLYSALAILAAVALPQLFHIAGAAAGIGSALGEILLPMHLPVMLAGLLAGVYVGAIAGALSPLISFALTGMPALAMLPFMTIELFVYGLVAGLLRKASLPPIAKVLIVQAAGRAVRAVAIVIAVYAFASTAIPVAVIWKSVAVGAIGLVLQWTLLPLLLYRVENKNRRGI